MKNIIFFIAILFSICTNAQIITTIAGNGIAGSSMGDGSLATAATLGYPCAGAIDKYGNYYFSTGESGCQIRRISPSGIISTVAGTGICKYGGDSGPATLASMNSPQGMAVDTAGNVYVADNNSNRIRKINVSTGIITTFAGNGTQTFSGDNGPATAAGLYDPLDVCFDKQGNMYIAEAGNFRVRKINTSGIITTFAGNGTTGVGTDNILATACKMEPFCVCADDLGNIYIGDDGIGETRVCRVDTSGIITTMAGDPNDYRYNGDNMPATNAYFSPVFIAVDHYGNLFISDQINHRIRRVDIYGSIFTVVGNGTSGYNGDNINATSAEINHPTGLALDSCDNLYIADFLNYRVRKVTYPYCHYLAIKNEQLTSHVITTYPNPTYNLLNIDNLATNSTYRLLSTIGTTVQQGTLNQGNNSISTQAMSSGLYMLEITDEEGKRSISKVVKQ